jgi:oligopeptide transport system substrate-binding protein
LKNRLCILLIVLMICTSLLGCSLLFPGTQLPAAPGGADVLNLFGEDPLTLDPAVASEATSHDYIVQIFSGLLKFDANMAPVADVARNWQINSDGTKYTFSLRQDVKFHDGRQLKAADFKYSWERACNPATHSLTAATYLGDIVGVNDELSGKSQGISGVRVLDDYTLEVSIDSPKSFFLDKLTYPTSFAVDRNNVSSGGSGWWHTPNGTGPFRLGQWTQNQSLTLDRNDSYYGGAASVKQIAYQILKGRPMDLFEVGQIDVASVSTGYIDEVLDKAGPYYDLLTVSPELTFYFIGYTCNQPPFDDARLRQAFSQAIDKDKIISLVYRDMQQRADGVLPPGMPGYNKNLVGLPFDVTKAKELIKASKYGDVSKLPPIVLTTSGWGGQVSQVLQSLVFQWKQNLGVDVKIRQLEPEQFLYNLKNETNQMYDMGWIADYPHPQDFLDILFHSGVDNNYGNYSNPAFDALVDQAARASDQAQSMALYQQAEKMMVNDAACLPITFGKNYYLTKPYVKGYSVSPLGFENLSQVSLQGK